MNKRDVKIYDESWAKVSDYHTEYDVEIITSMIEPFEWRQIVELEKEFDKRFPQYKFYYHLIESDPSLNNQTFDQNGKLVYKAE
ncbi:hypothetical protein [[Eubacterium] cellulosolvens]